MRGIALGGECVKGDVCESRRLHTEFSGRKRLKGSILWQAKCGFDLSGEFLGRGVGLIQVVMLWPTNWERGAIFADLTVASWKRGQAHRELEASPLY
jgi:hypothetical protein